MAIVKDLAQVLRVYEHGETSLVLVFLCRRLGQVRVLAKGARRWAKRGFAGGFDLLTEGELLAYPRPDESLWIFREWEERRRHAGLGRSRAALHAASFLCEFTEALTRETAGSAGPVEEPAELPRPAATPASAAGAAGWRERRETLYGLLAGSAEALSGGAPAGPVLLSFVLRALDLSGWLPDLSRCSTCGKPWARGRGGARLSHEGLECEECVAAGPLPGVGGSAPAIGGPARVSGGFAAVVERPGPGHARPAAASRGVWLTPEALGALAFVKRSGKGVRLTPAAAHSTARALVALVQGALERDLRTLPAAAAAVDQLGARVPSRSNGGAGAPGDPARGLIPGGRGRPPLLPPEAT